MNELKEYTEKMFEDIKHVDENGNDYWYASELMKVLEYISAGLRFPSKESSSQIQVVPGFSSVRL